MKLGILVAYKFLQKRVSQCISGHVISQNMEFIRSAISQPLLKIETSGLDQKIHRIMHSTFHYFWGHQVHFWSRDCALTIFFTEKCQYLSNGSC